MVKAVTGFVTIEGLFFEKENEAVLADATYSLQEALKTTVYDLNQFDQLCRFIVANPYVIIDYVNAVTIPKEIPEIEQMQEGKIYDTNTQSPVIETED